MLFTAVFASLAAFAAACPATIPVHPWVPPGPGDSRGPCPLLNTLANHGYLPHDGRNLTAKLVGDALVRAVNFDSIFATTPVAAFMKITGKTQFTLEDINQPGILQHIASLTRDDVDSKHSNMGLSHPRLAALLDDSPSDSLTIESMARSRLRVEALSKPRALSKEEVATSFGEAALGLLMMMKKPVPNSPSKAALSTWDSPKDRFWNWLVQERLPFELGWKRPARRIMLEDVMGAGARIGQVYESMKRKASS